MTDDRCGHVARASGIENAGAVCCWRPTWRDDERCIWHTASSVPTAAYERTDPESGARLDGADLREAVVPGTDLLAGCSLVGADFTNAVIDHADLSDRRRCQHR